MLRQGLLWLSKQPQGFRLVRPSRLARSLASRFMAGETSEEAVAAGARLASQGFTVTLDLLGESVTSVEAARAACEQCLALLDRMQAQGIEVNISVKLTQLGLDLDLDLCGGHLERILERVRAAGGFVRIDMEGSAYTDRTLDLFERRVHGAYGDYVGVVIQSMLRRSDADVERLLASRARVRLVKGAYLEPADIAFPEKRDVDAAFQRQMDRLLEAGNYPAIATHDGRLIEAGIAFAKSRAIPPDRFEFQMLYGVRRDLQQRLVARGFRVRVYVPFGSQWYPYLMRRLAERPANIAFILGNLVRERLAGG